MAKLNEREYQTRAVAELLKRFKKHQRIVAVSPTGSGKTVIAAAMLLKMKGKRVLWIAHRVELLNQARREIVAAGIPADDVGVLSGTDKENKTARVLVASVDMFRTRLVPNVDIIVVDEAHRTLAQSYQDIIYACPDALVLGLTATPERTDGQPLGDVFFDMYVVAEPIELIADGYIAQAACYGIPQNKAREILRGVKIGKDFNEKDLGKAMSKRALMGDTVKECARLAPSAATIVFAVNREHGRALLARFKKAKRSGEYLDGDTPSAERSEVIDRLKNCETEVVVNVDVLSEGFDCPAVKCIALCRPTKSLTRFLQQVGRAARPWRGKRPIILDHAGNCWRFGLPETTRDWSLDGREKSIGSGGPPVRQCPECEVMIPVSSKECPECGAEFPMTEREFAERSLDLERLQTSEADRAKQETLIRALAKARGLGIDWVNRVLAENLA